ncbi:MAG: hypothetical protein JM58_09495 [Peptococcaceae bacterium BICA1-8]|nr:MAG: hypothetical protein JM58_09495 [Peptococcaceae bacterium BICA1-8]
MKKYMGFKMLDAEPMNLGEYNKFRGWTIPADENPATEGYRVIYPDGYVSWRPREQFEKAYMQVGTNNTITQEMVDKFIGKHRTYTWGEKTTVVHATFINGFEVVESSSCVDPANYNEKIGENICLDKIKDKVWHLLGFLLQTAKEGIK